MIRSTILLALFSTLNAFDQAPAGRNHGAEIPGIKKKMFADNHGG